MGKLAERKRSVFSGFEALLHEAPRALDALMAALEAAAAERRARGGQFFAAFLDPGGTLPLSPLYDRCRRALQCGILKTHIEEGPYDTTAQ